MNAALELADKMRVGEETFSPSRLWKVAKDEGADYKEAMIHAGALGPKTEGEFVPYDVCPMCEETLAVSGGGM